MTSSSSTLPLIEMRDVVKVYSTAAGEFDALKGVNLHVSAGEFVGIVGKSGAGKSTLLNMITGVDHLTSGEVIVNSRGSSVSIHSLNEDQVALWRGQTLGDRKSTRLNSSHSQISYAVFCLKKKNT